MDFQAAVRIKRVNPDHTSRHILSFEASDWHEAQALLPTLALPQGYSAYHIDSVIFLERLM